MIGVFIWTLRDIFALGVLGICALVLLTAWVLDLLQARRARKRRRDD